MDEHERLLERWSKQPDYAGKRFINDGIIDQHRWSRAPRRVLLLLKEAYGDYGDLRELIREDWKGPRHKVWWLSALWCYAIHHAKSTVPSMPDSREEYARATDALLASAAVNIKKCEGRSASDGDEIGAFAKRDGEFIRAQVELIDPDFVVCGNTWGAVEHLWPERIPLHDLVWRVNSRVIVDFWHPANRYPNKLNYYALACCLQNAGVFSDEQLRGPHD